MGLLTALIVALCLTTAAWARVPDRPGNMYVLDSAGVLSEGLERRIIAENDELFEECGGEIVIVAVDFLGGESIEDYTYDLFESWEIGSVERNNGILLVLAVGEDKYFVQAGYGIDDYFDGAMLDEILEENLSQDFDAGDYEAGVEKTFDALYSELRAYYRTGPGSDDPMPGYDDSGWDEDGDFSGGGLFRSLKTIAIAIVRVIVIVVIILFVLSLFRGPRGGGPGGGGGGGFWRGMWLGSMLGGRRRTYWGAPPPPPPPGGFGPGGFGGFGGSGGFHRGGGARGGGAGRGFGGGGGGGFHRGGGTHGGGAGRR